MIHSRTNKFLLIFCSFWSKFQLHDSRKPSRRYFKEDCSDKGLQNSVYLYSVNYYIVNLYITSYNFQDHYCEFSPFEPVEFVEVDGSSHKSIEPSLLPDANVLPSGLKETLLTKFVCPVSVCRRSPLPTSHNRTVLSQLPDANFLPSGLKETLLTLSVCSVNMPT